jgi:hypothetical protein
MFTLAHENSFGFIGFYIRNINCMYLNKKNE